MVSVSCQGRETVLRSALWPVQGMQGGNHLGPEGIQVEGPDKLQGVDAPGAGLRQAGQAGDEVSPVPVIPEDGGPLHPPHHDVVQGLRSVESGLAGHSRGGEITSRQKTQRPPFRPPSVPIPLSASGGAVPGSGVCRAVKVIGEPDAGEPHVRFDEGVLGLEYGRASEAPPDERGGNS